MDKETVNRDNIQGEGWDKHHGGRTLFFFLTQVECIISTTWKEKVHGNDKSCSQQWPMAPLSSHVNPGNYILKQKYCNSVKNVTLQLKSKLFILKLNYNTGFRVVNQSCYQSTSHLIVNQVFCVIVKLKSDF